MTVLQSTLELLRARLEAALQVAAPSGEPWVKLTNPVGQDGQVAVGARDKIVMTLVGLETDTSVTSRPAAHPTPAPLNVNISLLFVANFTDSNYPTGLDMLAHVVSFFHATPVFTRALLSRRCSRVLTTDMASPAENDRLSPRRTVIPPKRKSSMNGGRCCGARGLRG